jgi:hypothetical protein
MRYKQKERGVQTNNKKHPGSHLNSAYSAPSHFLDLLIFGTSVLLSDKFTENHSKSTA